MPTFGFIGPTYTSQAIAADGERAINLYLERVEAKDAWVLYGTPGLKLHATTPDSPGRGLWAGEGRLFAAAGNHVYEVFKDGSTVAADGTIGDPGDDSPVQFFAPSVSIELFIVASGRAWLHDGLKISPVMVGGEPLTAKTGAYLDGYFIVARPDSKQFNFAGPVGTDNYIKHRLDWDALDFEIKEGAADNINAIHADHGELWLLGKATTEIWANSGGANSPFARVQGAFQEIGTIAARSVAKVGNPRGGSFLMCLSGDDHGAGVVNAWSGFTAMRVSNHAVEYAIQGYAKIDDAVAYSYEDQGHYFYVLSFPTAKATWVYDTTTGQWHERGYWNAAQGQYEDVLGRYHAYVWGRHFVQDRRNGKIYEQSIRYYDDAGAPIRRLRSAPHLVDELGWMLFRELRIDMQTGVVPNGLDPVIVMQISDDGGYTWSNEITGTVGKIGEYLWRVVWRRLGRSRKRCYRVIITDPIPVCLVEAYSK